MVKNDICLGVEANTITFFQKICPEKRKKILKQQLNYKSQTKPSIIILQICKATTYNFSRNALHPVYFSENFVNFDNFSVKDIYLFKVNNNGKTKKYVKYVQR